MKFVAFALGMALAVGGAAPVLAAEAESGREIAKRWCSSCHLVEQGQPAAADVAPSFMEIAESLEPSADWLAARLNDPHPVMPPIQLSTQELDDLAAYFASLGAE